MRGDAHSAHGLESRDDAGDAVRCRSINIASAGVRIIIQPRCLFVVASDLNDLHLVLTDQRKTP